MGKTINKRQLKGYIASTKLTWIIILIRYLNLGHEFYPSSQCEIQHDPIHHYVLRDLHSEHEAYSVFKAFMAVILLDESINKST